LVEFIGLNKALGIKIALQLTLHLKISALMNFKSNIPANFIFSAIIMINYKFPLLENLVLACSLFIRVFVAITTRTVIFVRLNLLISENPT
jgi:hypothetical protein